MRKNPLFTFKIQKIVTTLVEPLNDDVKLHKLHLIYIKCLNALDACIGRLLIFNIFSNKAEGNANFGSRDYDGTTTLSKTGDFSADIYNLFVEFLLCVVHDLSEPPSNFRIYLFYLSSMKIRRRLINYNLSHAVPLLKKQN